MGAQDSADEDGNPIEKTEYIKQEFPLDEFEVEFEAMNPPIEIPDEVVEDIDNDFDIPFTPVDPSAEWEQLQNKTKRLGKLGVCGWLKQGNTHSGWLELAEMLPIKGTN